MCLGRSFAWLNLFVAWESGGHSPRPGIGPAKIQAPFPDLPPSTPSRLPPPTLQPRLPVAGPHLQRSEPSLCAAGLRSYCVPANQQHADAPRNSDCGVCRPSRDPAPPGGQAFCFRGFTDPLLPPGRFTSETPWADVRRLGRNRKGLRELSSHGSLCPTRLAPRRLEGAEGANAGQVVL